jgi:Leucine-rich repeat (LRR) protein
VGVLYVSTERESRLSHLSQELYLHDSYGLSSLPFSIGELSKLTSLSDAGNGLLSGTIPRSLALLTDLKTLTLMNNQLTGDISFLPFDQYGDCDLSRNSFNCPIPDGAKKKCGVIKCRNSSHA